LGVADWWRAAVWVDDMVKLAKCKRALLEINPLGGQPFGFNFPC
jgi:hypothetical protein